MKLPKLLKKSVAAIFLLAMVVLPFQNCSGGFQAMNQSATQASLGTNPPPSTTTPSGTKTSNAVIAWDKSSSASLKGYHIYLGTQSGSYDKTLDAGATSNPAAPQYQLTGLSAGSNYVAVVKAYDVAGEESIASNEIQIPAK